MDNLMCNFAEQEQVFQVTVAGITYTVLLEDFVTASTFAAYINAKLSNQNLKMIDQPNASTWEAVLQFKFQLNNTDVQSTLSGSSLSRLGLEGGIAKTTHKGIGVMNFSGPQIVHVNLQGLDSMRHNTIQSTYQIPCTSSFGSLLLWQDFQETEQQYKLDRIESTAQFIIQLFDERGYPLRSVRSTKAQTGQQGIDFTIIIQSHIFEN